MLPYGSRCTKRTGRGTALVALLALLAACVQGLGAQERRVPPSAPEEAPVVRGTVVRADDGTPVAGAYVSLLDRTGAGVAVASSDESGRFRLTARGSGSGPYRVRAARTAAATWTSPPLELRPGAAHPLRIELEISRPALEALRADAETRCARAGGDGWAEDGATVVGTVRDGATGQPVDGAQVWLRRGEADAVPLESGPSGAFLLCGLEGGEAELQASGPGRLGPSLRLDAGAGSFRVRDLLVSRRMLARAMERDSLEAASLRGQVRAAETGEPVAGARVSLPEIGVSRVTDEEGRFVIPGLFRRPYYVVTEYLGAASDTVPVDLTWGSVTVALLTLETKPVELPVLRVELERTIRNRRIRDFYERMERGLGQFITREDLRYLDVVGSFRRLIGVTVRPCSVGFSRSSRCYEVDLGRSRRGAFLGSPCRPVIYLDGLRLPDRTDMNLDNAFSFLMTYEAALEGIEVYRNPIWAPGPYRTLDDACGIVLAWTRRR